MGSEDPENGKTLLFHQTLFNIYLDQELSCFPIQQLVFKELKVWWGQLSMNMAVLLTSML